VKLINILCNSVKPLSIYDSIGKAFDEFEKMPYDYLPVVDKGELLCCLQRESIAEFSDTDSIKDVVDCSEIFFAQVDLNIFDVMRLFYFNGSNLMPVVDEERRYLGSVLMEDLISEIGKTPFVIESGGVLVVKRSIKEYSISEIANIVESENAKILGIITSDFVDNDVVLTIKINQVRLANIESALKRFGYIIVDSYHENKNFNNYNDRYRHLMNYLDI
jgi:predicted transcriptional regulator